MEQFKPFPLNQAVSVGNMGTIIKPNGRQAKQSAHSLGYLSVGITIGDKCKVMKAHRVIALTWCDNPSNKATVNHKNGIKTDNRAENLEWMTLSENHLHAHATGLHTGSAGTTRKPHSDATKQRMREAKLGRHREGPSGKWTDEKPIKTKFVTSTKERTRLLQNSPAYKKLLKELRT